MANKKIVGTALSKLLGTNMQACRKRKGMTQSEVAQELGVEVETVPRYERGTVAPSFPQLENICKVFNVNASLLFSDGHDAPNAQDMTVVDLQKGLSASDRDFIRSFVQAYALHHQVTK